MHLQTPFIVLASMLLVPGIVARESIYGYVEEYDGENWYVLWAQCKLLLDSMLT